MDPDKQISRVPFTASGNDSFFVDGSVGKYLVQRIRGVADSVCPGDHLNGLDLNSDDDDLNVVMEPCKAFSMFRACQHTFGCECADYTKGNDCKHIILG